MPTTIYLDTETTGLDAFFGDEIVEIAIIDEKGKVLLNTLVQPLTSPLAKTRRFLYYAQATELR